ncbi:hypothetical protein Amsp01_030670 [Amycolatopsis sp. NBRC 101858]|uniref:hypothetical protein n=1 Tax=Amycolatopsis sp. NBRC 101858 TaxID=3032200 RepID=UPI0024A2D6A1|nr:hypothetical protein [Amycolatopsis sp. NBRC 101858]GLY37043.1 hypothetical protein Amsp01_030670 [Amycolatopsis sp. NBRC 101858]
MTASTANLPSRPIQSVLSNANSTNSPMTRPMSEKQPSTAETTPARNAPTLNRLTRERRLGEPLPAALRRGAVRQARDEEQHSDGQGEEQARDSPSDGPFRGDPAGERVDCHGLTAGGVPAARIRLRGTPPHALGQ